MVGNSDARQTYRRRSRGVDPLVQSKKSREAKSYQTKRDNRASRRYTRNIGVRRQQHPRAGTCDTIRDKPRRHQRKAAFTEGINPKIVEGANGQSTQGRLHIRSVSTRVTGQQLVGQRYHDDARTTLNAARKDPGIHDSTVQNEPQGSHINENGRWPYQRDYELQRSKNSRRISKRPLSLRMISEVALTSRGRPPIPVAES